MYIKRAAILESARLQSRRNRPQRPGTKYVALIQTIMLSRQAVLLEFLIAQEQEHHDAIQNTAQNGDSLIRVPRKGVSQAGCLATAVSRKPPCQLPLFSSIRNIWFNP